jgi:glycosyltransferase involved in cell wall biosynthesis
VARGRVIWPLYHALRYPIYEEFNRKVYQQFQGRIKQGEYDIVHVLTPMEPRYPFKIVSTCQSIPSLIGPVNGGVPFPPGFREQAKREFASFNFLRAIGRWFLPQYTATYRNATKVLAGSTYTLNLIQTIFKLPQDQLELFYENGVLDHFLTTPRTHYQREKVNLLFVGRLVPYKCADILIDAISQLPASSRDQLTLSIVGDGPEKQALEHQVQRLGLQATVNFLGWVAQSEIVNHYQSADIFCFPSIREYGGAVVLEAMACGLPCIVANNGGIGEYVTPETGFSIEPISREFLTQELAEKIQILATDESLWRQMSKNSLARAQKFTWSYKAQQLIEIYEQLMAQNFNSQKSLTLV